MAAPGWPPAQAVELAFDMRDHWVRGLVELSQGPVPSQPRVETPPYLQEDSDCSIVILTDGSQLEVEEMDVSALLKVSPREEASLSNLLPLREPTGTCTGC